MARYNLNDRPVPGGSMEPRLNPNIVERQLNAKLGGIPEPDRGPRKPASPPVRSRSPTPVPGAG